MLAPWIENMIQSYGSEDRTTGSPLKAHITGISELSDSQAQDSEDPRKLIFLSDGVVQIPAVLTKSAWEHLQEKEDRECFNSLVNTTVCIQDYSLQFHLAVEQTRCRFVLSVGLLATTAAGPVKEKTPCCTSLPSVRLQICKVWRSLLGQGQAESQQSQLALDLSDLLGEWQHDVLHFVLEDVQNRLKVDTKHAVGPQPSTSSCNPSVICRDALVATAWDMDRVRDKGQESFSIPIKYLLIPQEATQQQKVSDLLTASDDKRTNLHRACRRAETVEASVEVRGRLSRSAGLQPDHQASEDLSLPEDMVLHEDVLTEVSDSDLTSLSNPWNTFPRPCETAGRDATPEVALVFQQPLHKPAETRTSTQLYAHSSKETPTSVQSKGELSYFPPYQKPPPSAYSPSAPASLREPVTRLCNTVTAADILTHMSQQNLTSDQQSKTFQMQKENTERIHTRSKEQRMAPTPDAPIITGGEGEETKISQSPPSWLFETQTPSVAEQTGNNKHTQSAGKVQRGAASVHSDCKPFAYSYHISSQTTAAFSRFRVTDNLLHWAVKYLVGSKQTDDAHSSAVPVASGQGSGGV
ncbi:adrenocortical dysplasia protein homolog [Thalassophryne amazonica]|uniref:adrenocortical dysplasia protein homolog n=1 Tax=Thalassophryne amazonica TaxID=390379 RepID=UPI001470FC8E|nr:adrenocortical dysplasia protein homolog [Thalassophryne amazonica]